MWKKNESYLDISTQKALHMTENTFDNFKTQVIVNSTPLKGRVSNWDTGTLILQGDTTLQVHHIT